MKKEEELRKSTDEGSDAFARALPHVFFRRILAEVVGSFALVFVDCGGAVIAGMSHGEVSPAARSAATGLLVMVAVYTLGDVSGAHLNPAVTLAFTLRRVFPWRHLPAYWAAQFTGAMGASISLYALFGNVEHLGATLPHFGDLRAFAVEVVLTMMVVGVSLGTATRHRVIGANAAIASGGAVALCSLFSRPISGASMNPARSLAPALVTQTMTHCWIYLIAPFVGAALTTALMNVIHARKHREELEAAGGERKE